MKGAVTAAERHRYCCNTNGWELEGALQPRCVSQTGVEFVREPFNLQRWFTGFLLPGAQPPSSQNLPWSWSWVCPCIGEQQVWMAVPGLRCSGRGPSTLSALQVTCVLPPLFHLFIFYSLEVDVHPCGLDKYKFSDLYLSKAPVQNPGLLWLNPGRQNLHSKISKLMPAKMLYKSVPNKCSRKLLV